jgi:pSer/pThr/pTyr-binding forkhead associated (FHA) protein
VLNVELIIGRKNGVPTPNVILGALGIEANHAKIYRHGDKIFIKTYNETAGDFTYVNGENIYESIEIFHNDRIIFGTSCVFLLKIP